MYIRKVFSTTLTRLQEPRATIQVLLGPRQVGKTTGARFILEKLEKEDGIKSIYAAADEPELKDRHWLNQQWELARDRCRTSGKPTVLVVDEIQKIEGWSELIKKLWDEDTFHGLDLRVLLLGSSTLLIRDGLTESLAGRFEINPVTHWLYSEMKEAFQFSLEDWIYYGGYPGGARLKNDPERWGSFVRDALIETTLSRDILLLKKIEKPALLRRLFQLGCTHSGQILSFQKMLRQLQDAGNASTLSHYLELLSQTGLLTGLSKYSGTEVRQKASSPKLQVLNTGLTNAQSSRSFQEIRSNPEDWGRLVESAVGVHLYNSIVGKNSELLYWRERNQEVDYILKRGDQCVAFEVKSGARKESPAGLKEFSNRFHPVKSWVVGDSYGLTFEEFFSSNVERWWKV